MTVGISEDGFEAAVTLYKSVDGHAKKSCEETFETFVGKMSSLSIGKVGGQTYLCFYGYNNYGGGYDSISHYFKIEDGAFSQADDLFEAERYNMETDTVTHTYTASGKEITESEFKAIEQEYTDGKRLLGLDFGEVYVEDRGPLPDPSAVMQKIYTAVKNGDFSFFAGTYRKSFGDSFSEKLTLNKDGTLSGGNDYNTANNQKPVSITVTSKGIIRCVITPVGLDDHYDEDFGEWYSTWHGDIYDICPIGIEWDKLAEIDGYLGPIHDITTDTNSLRIVYTN